MQLPRSATEHRTLPRGQIMRYKDGLKVGDTYNVIYQIAYIDCPCDYVGKTGRKLITRLQEHK